ncbi:MAG: glutathione S-transferase N-terminal domain-containing protein [Patulibacter sp.]
MATVKLHRCNYTFLHTDLDACWRVQKALDEQGVDYEIVKHGWGKPKQRPAVEALSGQSKLPVLELSDGTVYREESKDMAAKVRAGELPTG